MKIRKHLRNIFWGSYEDIMKLPLRRVGKSWKPVAARLLENPFAIYHVMSISPRKVLDIGCAKNTLALELATLGFNVTGVDLRDYPFFHPNFQFKKGNFLDVEFNSRFDAITCISTFEHVGLGAYGEVPSEEVPAMFAKKVVSLLTKNGYLVLTVPLHDAEEGFERDLSAEDIKAYFQNLELAENRFFKLVDQYYIETDYSIESLIGCFLFQKT